MFYAYCINFIHSLFLGARAISIINCACSLITSRRIMILSFSS